MWIHIKWNALYTIRDIKSMFCYSMWINIKFTVSFHSFQKCNFSVTFLAFLAFQNNQQNLTPFLPVSYSIMPFIQFKWFNAYFNTMQHVELKRKCNWHVSVWMYGIVEWTYINKMKLQFQSYNSRSNRHIILKLD